MPNFVADRARRGATSLPPARRATRRRRALLLALAASVALHLAVSMGPEPWSPAPEDAPLTVKLETLPPPPAPAAIVAPSPPAPSTVKRRAVAKPRARPRAAPPVIASPAPAEIAAPELSHIEIGPPATEAHDSPGIADAQPGQAAAAAIAAPEVPESKTLPPRIDLAYKIFLGTRGFEIGAATYRFEHANHRYRIRTVGRAIGLAAILMRGDGRIESTGMITPQGLQPIEFSVDRFNGRGHESARFDWETGVATLHEDKRVALDVPTFDPLTLMWQSYFTPPDADVLTISIATTRRIAHYTLRREGHESVRWADRMLDTERWARVSDDGKTEAYAWLAPELRYLPVKMRVASTSRGTLEAVLDAIRVDETGELLGRDDVPLLPSPPEPTHDRASPDSMPGYSPPGATFPTMQP